MANVLVNETSLQDIAAAIRYKNGQSTRYTPSQMAQAVRNIPSGGGGSILVPKTITANGTYDPASDNADGYSLVTVDVPSWRTPIAYDFTGGYCDGTSWTPEDTTNNYSDLYAIEQDHKYYLKLGNTVGTRFRAMQLDTNPIGSSRKINGTKVVSEKDPQPATALFFTAILTGYLVVTKDYVGTTGLKTYLADVTVD